MAEHQVRTLTPVEIAYRCDESTCDGNVVYSPETQIPSVILSDHIYLHKCDKCGQEYRLVSIYPTIRYL